MRPLGAGAQLAGVRVIEHLHRSNRLDVYDAWCERRACRVVVKTLRPDRLAERSSVLALIREGQLLRRLAHPHLVRAYEVHEAPRPAIVLETLTGATLEHVVREQRPLSAAELAVVGEQLAAAVGYLHSEGVLHLDLKTANVVAEAGRVKVIDLSHARPPGPLRRGGGTWFTMAPEQVRGGVICTAADVWGLGIVLHEAALGRAPLLDLADELDSDTPQLEVRIPSLRAEGRRLPRALAATLHACLEPDPAARPTVAELRTTCAASL
jgi:serine/threonine protein kinase